MKNPALTVINAVPVVGFVPHLNVFMMALTRV